jgi:hypothetical protein
MNHYANVAIKAFEYFNSGLSVETSWKKASCEFYKKDSAAQRKGCPKCAFFGLVSPESTKSVNAKYARQALDILRSNLNRKYSAEELWLLIDNASKTHNSQMDVVLALWNNKSIS